LNRAIIVAYCAARNLPYERRRVGVGAAEQAQEVLAAAFRISRQLERRDEHRGEDSIARQRIGRGFALERGQQVEALLIHRVEPAGEHRLEELFLAAEVIVDGARLTPAAAVIARKLVASKPCSMNNVSAGIEKSRLGFDRAATFADCNHLSHHRRAPLRVD
jgi:hypothetical protein